MRIAWKESHTSSRRGCRNSTRLLRGTGNEAAAGIEARRGVGSEDGAAAKKYGEPQSNSRSRRGYFQSILHSIAPAHHGLQLEGLPQAVRLV